MAKMKKKLSVTKSTTPTQRRLWLMFPPKLIKEPSSGSGRKFRWWPTSGRPA